MPPHLKKKKKISFCRNIEIYYEVYFYITLVSSIIHLILINNPFNWLFTDRWRDKWQISTPQVCGMDIKSEFISQIPFIAIALQVEDILSGLLLIQMTKLSIRLRICQKPERRLPTDTAGWWLLSKWSIKAPVFTKAVEKTQHKILGCIN